MKNIKSHQRNQLLIEYGILMQPIFELVNSNVVPQISEYRIAMTKIHSGSHIWIDHFREFATFANDLVFDNELNEMASISYIFAKGISNKIGDNKVNDDLANLQNEIRKYTDEYKIKCIIKIDSIPIEWEPEIFLTNTPFTSYLKIKELVTTATTMLHYYDRYIKKEFYQLFLPEIKRNVSVRIITTRGNTSYGINHLEAISNLVRQEYFDYQLIEVDPDLIHDRNIRIDSKIYSLGPGIDRAGVALTNFNPSDSSIAAHSELDRIIALGKIIHQS